MKSISSFVIFTEVQKVTTKRKLFSTLEANEHFESMWRFLLLIVTPAYLPFSLDEDSSEPLLKKINVKTDIGETSVQLPENTDAVLTYVSGFLVKNTVCHICKSKLLDEICNTPFLQYKKFHYLANNPLKEVHKKMGAFVSETHPSFCTQDRYSKNVI